MFAFQSVFERGYQRAYGSPVGQKVDHAHASQLGAKAGKASPFHANLHVQGWAWVSTGYLEICGY
jgi:hypothetical protein